MAFDRLDHPLSHPRSPSDAFLRRARPRPALVHVAGHDSLRARAAPASRLAGDIGRRLRYRVGHRQDRQGGRRVPHRARRSRLSRVRPRSEALPRLRALRLPSIRAIRRGPATAQLARRARHRAQVLTWPRGCRGSLGAERVRRTLQSVGCRHPGSLSRPVQRHRTPDGVHRRRPRRSAATRADRGCTGPSSPTCSRR